MRLELNGIQIGIFSIIGTSSNQHVARKSGKVAFYYVAMSRNNVFTSYVVFPFTIYKRDNFGHSSLSLPTKVLLLTVLLETK